MATFDETLFDIEGLKNTLDSINQALDIFTEEKLNSYYCNYDKDRIDAIRDFLELQKQEVLDALDCLINSSVSGAC